MVRNSDLFKKIMRFSKELKMSAGGPFDRKPGFPPFRGPEMQGGRMMPPPPFGDQRGFGEPQGNDGNRRPPMPPFGGPQGPQGPHGPHGHGMNREHMLVIISDYPDGIRQKDLAENAGINPSSTSEVVSRLEDDGYLIRTIDPSDKRATVLKLTEMGAVRAEEIRSEREAFLDDFFGKLTDDEKQQLSDLLDKLMNE